MFGNIFKNRFENRFEILFKSFKCLLIIALIILSIHPVYSQRKKKSRTQIQLEEAQEELRKKDSLDSIKFQNLIKDLPGAPVIPFRDTVLYIYGNIGSISSSQRASNISKNIKELGQDKSFNSDSLKINYDSIYAMYTIDYMGKTILGINDLQAFKLNKAQEDIIKEYRNDIIQSIKKNQEENSLTFILKEFGLCLLFFIICVAIIRLIIFLYKKLKAYLQSQQGKRIKGFSTLIDAEKSVQILVSLANFIKILLILLTIYLCLSSIFSIFPATKNLSTQLLQYIISPLKIIYQKIINYFPNIITIIIIFLIFKYLRRFIKAFAIKIRLGKIKIRGFYPDWAMPTYNLINIISYIFMFIFIFPYLPDSNSPIFQGVSVFMGILFSLGSTSIIGNIVSGIVITYMRPFKVGDRIKINDFTGNVVEKTPLVVRLKTAKNEIITIPNSSVMSSNTINYTSSAHDYGLILYTTVNVSYDIPWEKVHELLFKVTEGIPDILEDPKPFVLDSKLDNYNVEYQLNVYTKKANSMNMIYSEINKNILKVFSEAGIVLVSPSYYAKIEDNKADSKNEDLDKNINEDKIN